MRSTCNRRSSKVGRSNTLNRRRLFDHSSDNPRSHHYWAYTTGRFKNTRSIEFDEDMRGVANPIVTSFAVWPVCKQFVYLNRSASLKTCCCMRRTLFINGDRFFFPVCYLFSLFPRKLLAALTWNVACRCGNYPLLANPDIFLGTKDQR